MKVLMWAVWLGGLFNAMVDLAAMADRNGPSESGSLVHPPRITTAHDHGEKMAASKNRLPEPTSTPEAKPDGFITPLSLGYPPMPEKASSFTSTDSTNTQEATSSPPIQSQKSSRTHDPGNKIAASNDPPSNTQPTSEPLLSILGEHYGAGRDFRTMRDQTRTTGVPRQEVADAPPTSPPQGQKSDQPSAQNTPPEDMHPFGNFWNTHPTLEHSDGQANLFDSTPLPENAAHSPSPNKQTAPSDAHQTPPPKNVTEQVALMGAYEMVRALNAPTPPFLTPAPLQDNQNDQQKSLPEVPRDATTKDQVSGTKSSNKTTSDDVASKTRLSLCNASSRDQDDKILSSTAARGAHTQNFILGYDPRTTQHAPTVKQSQNEAPDKVDQALASHKLDSGQRAQKHKTPPDETAEIPVVSKNLSMEPPTFPVNFITTQPPNHQGLRSQENSLLSPSVYDHNTNLLGLKSCNLSQTVWCFTRRRNQSNNDAPHPQLTENHPEPLIHPPLRITPLGDSSTPQPRQDVHEGYIHGKHLDWERCFDMRAAAMLVHQFSLSPRRFATGPFESDGQALRAALSAMNHSPMLNLCSEVARVMCTFGFLEHLRKNLEACASSPPSMLSDLKYAAFLKECRSTLMRPESTLLENLVFNHGDALNLKAAPLHDENTVYLCVPLTDDQSYGFEDSVKVQLESLRHESRPGDKFALFTLTPTETNRLHAIRTCEKDFIRARALGVLEHDICERCRHACDTLTTYITSTENVRDRIDRLTQQHKNQENMTLGNILAQISNETIACLNNLKEAWQDLTANHPELSTWTTITYMRPFF